MFAESAFADQHIICMCLNGQKSKMGPLELFIHLAEVLDVIGAFMTYHLMIPQAELAMRGSNGVGKGPWKATWGALVADFD